MNSHSPYGASNPPLTSSSDSLCGTEKQLVTSTECLSTVPVRENSPSVIKSWASNCPKCFQEVSSKSRNNNKIKFQPCAPMEAGFSREMKLHSYLQLSNRSILPSQGLLLASLPATHPAPDLHSKIFVFSLWTFFLI